MLFGVQGWLLYKVMECGLRYLEGVQPLVVIPGALNDVLPPVLAGRVGPEAMRIEPKELLDGGHGS